MIHYLNLTDFADQSYWVDADIMVRTPNWQQLTKKQFLLERFFSSKIWTEQSNQLLQTDWMSFFLSTVNEKRNETNWPRLRIFFFKFQRIFFSGRFTSGASWTYREAIRFVKTQRITLNFALKTLLLGKNLSRPLFRFIFPFSRYIVSLHLIIFTMVNDDRKQERRRKSMHRSIIRYLKKPDTQ